MFKTHICIKFDHCIAKTYIVNNFYSIKKCDILAIYALLRFHIELTYCIEFD